ncbi:MAG: Gp138 family membrane-puncturing spike protein [Acutalibacteraceae bacterium]
MSYGSKQSDLRAAESEKNRAGVRVSMPVKVLAFYPDKMTVDVQPLVKESIDGQYASAAPLMGLRVACLCAGEFTIRPWYKRGDVGWVIVSDFDADAVLQTGAEAEPNTARNHAPEDGLFVGGVCPDGRGPDRPAWQRRRGGGWRHLYRRFCRWCEDQRQRHRDRHTISWRH